MKFTTTTEHKLLIRRFAGIVTDWTITRCEHPTSYVVHAETWTKVAQFPHRRAICTRTLAEAIAFIERSESLAAKLYGNEKHERIGNQRRVASQVYTQE